MYVKTQPSTPSSLMQIDRRFPLRLRWAISHGLKALGLRARLQMSTMLSTLEVDRARLLYIDARLAELERSLDALRSRAPLETDRARLADIDTEIMHLEHSLVGLRTENAVVKERLDLYKYPVSKLPNEIMSEIFIHFLPIYPLCPPLVGISSPISLTQICRVWREIALATPALWRAIQLLDYRITFDTTKTWLDRSGCCPLSVFLEGDELLHAIAPYHARLEHLHVMAADLTPLHTQMPLLRRLDLTLISPTGDITFDDAPLLCTATISHLALHVLVLPWSQLTSLTLNHVNRSQVVRILQQTTNLVHCELLILGIGRLAGTSGITLPCLQSLALHDEDALGSRRTAFLVPLFRTTYLELFIVPALRSLQVAETSLGQNPIDTLASFMRNSSCDLQEVSVHFPRLYKRVEADDASFRETFASIPQFTFVKE
ncbi:hypothetical protein DFH06DRAFT_1129078 [Mycena polygramma]|nr:hypothetical protein DFH06DRAFT_1129078 [Mycena polygramma]